MRTKAELLAAIRADQRFWRDLAAEVGPDRYAEPGPMGEWTFGDMAGHLAGWRKRTIARLEAASRGEPEPAAPWPPAIDDATDDDATINAWIHQHHAGRSPEDLVAEYDSSYDRLAAAIEALPDTVSTDPDGFPWIGGPLVDADFTDHLHDEHVPSVRAWLDGS
jgi:Mycothiol maleylpyruvate isomerase N-terminal domain